MYDSYIYIYLYVYKKFQRSSTFNRPSQYAHKYPKFRFTLILYIIYYLSPIEVHSLHLNKCSDDKTSLFFLKKKTHVNDDFLCVFMSNE